MRVALALLASLLLWGTAEGACRTLTLPSSNNNGGQHWWNPGSNYLRYSPPPGGTAGLEFWWHQFDGSAPPWTLYTLVYLNTPTLTAQRIFSASNGADEANTGKAPPFALSTHVNPGEEFIVNVLNTDTVPRYVGLIVTIRECTP